MWGTGPECPPRLRARKSVQAPVPEVSTGSGAGSQYRLRSPEVSTGSGARKSVQAPVPEGRCKLQSVQTKFAKSEKHCKGAAFRDRTSVQNEELF